MIKLKPGKIQFTKNPKTSQDEADTDYLSTDSEPAESKKVKRPYQLKPEVDINTLSNNIAQLIKQNSLDLQKELRESEARTAHYIAATSDKMEKKLADSDHRNTSQNSTINKQLV